MSNTVILKNSSVPGKQPLASQLVPGELAVNTADAKIYLKNTQGQIVEISGGGGSTGDFIPTTEKGAANGVATLDANGIILTTQLPSYVDDVLEYTTLANFPATGETGKIYVETSTNKSYRWTGSTYVYITSGAVDSVAGKTGVVTLTASDVSGLAAVATSGSYNDLSNKPVIPDVTKLVRTTTFNADARGTRVVISSSVTIPASVYSAGDAFSFYNNTASPVSIVQGSGLTLRQDGTTNTGTRTLAPYGTCFVWYDTPVVAVIGGSLT
jgi:hypothetical protein